MKTLFVVFILALLPGCITFGSHSNGSVLEPQPIDGYTRKRIIQNIPRYPIRDNRPMSPGKKK